MQKSILISICFSLCFCFIGIITTPIVEFCFIAQILNPKISKLFTLHISRGSFEWNISSFVGVHILNGFGTFNFIRGRNQLARLQLLRDQFSIFERMLDNVTRFVCRSWTIRSIINDSLLNSSCHRTVNPLLSLRGILNNSGTSYHCPLLRIDWEQLIPSNWGTVCEYFLSILIVIIVAVDSGSPQIVSIDNCGGCK